MIEKLIEIIESEPYLNEIKKNVNKCVKLSEYVYLSLKLGLAIAVIILQNELNENGKAKDEYDYFCPICGSKLNSKGREINKLVFFIFSDLGILPHFLPVFLDTNLTNFI